MTEVDVVTPSWSIDDMPTLKRSLGSARVDRIRHHQHYARPELRPATSNRTRYIDNPHREWMESIEPHSGGPVDDVISGIASLEFGSTKQLSTTRLHNMLQLFDRVCTEDLMTTLMVDKRQAQRYLLALKLCIKHLTTVCATHATGASNDTV